MESIDTNSCLGLEIALIRYKTYYVNVNGDLLLNLCRVLKIYVNLIESYG